MSKALSPAWSEKMYIIDRSNELDKTDPLYAFALDELLCQEAYEQQISFCHIWRHPNAFILGQRDSHLPNAVEAMEWLSSIGYTPVIRNSGGAAVPLDLDTINISLIFPIEKSKPSTYKQDFERMYTLIRDALLFTGKEIDKGEIQGAFCPGEYDLSIAGRKFCGIAQRRKLHAYSVQAFVITGGVGEARTQLVREFYNRAAIGADAVDYPLVTDESTASLSELTGLAEHATQSFKDAIIQTLTSTPQSPSNIAQPLLFQQPNQAQVQALAEKLRLRYSAQK